MRRKIIGTKDFQGAVDVTDPCYSRNVWCRMNNISIKKGLYTCIAWYHTEKFSVNEQSYTEKHVGILGIYLNGIIPPQKSMEEIGSIGLQRKVFIAFRAMAMVAMAFMLKNQTMKSSL